MKTSQMILSAAVSGLTLGLLAGKASASSTGDVHPAIGAPVAGQLDADAGSGSKHACKGQGGCRTDGK
jgi:hypothetical protein